MTVSFPSDGTARAEDDNANHAVEFEELLLDPFPDGIAESEGIKLLGISRINTKK